MTSCKGFFEDENDSSAQFSSSNDTKPLLTGVKIQSSSWHSFNELKGIGLEFDNFIKTKLDQTKRGISLRLTGDVRDYKISKVEVFQKSKKRGAEGGFSNTIGLWIAMVFVSKSFISTRDSLEEMDSMLICRPFTVL